ncbi:MAG: hypothetical protein ACOY82_06180 [Pseudomonadota bacterium]
MSEKPRRYRIFISSSRDMEAEKRIAEEVIRKLDAELPGIGVEVYLSDHALYWAHASPQDSIPDPLDFDLVVALLWSRLGTPLEGEKYLGPDGERQTGTEYECARVIAAARAAERSGGEPKPQMLAYRSTREVMYRSTHLQEDLAQHQALEKFIARWFQDGDGVYRGYARRYREPVDFGPAFERDLRLWLESKREAVVWDVALRGTPFRGLEYFDRDHAPVFFGREVEVRTAIGLLDRARTEGFGVLWVFGASGSGKSSLLHAGLLPSIERSDPDLRTMIFSPGELGTNACLGFSNRLLRAMPELARGSHPDAEALASLFAVEDPEPGLHALETVLDQWAETRARARKMPETSITKLLVVVDQAEEWLTKRSEEERVWWSRTLAAWVRSGRVTLAIGARLDFHSSFKSDAGFRCLLDPEPVQSLLIWRLSARQRLSMIEGPCQAAGLELETDQHGRSLRDIIEADTQGDGSLPMLQFVMQSLFEQACARREKVLRLDDYDALGGAAGALGQVAEQALSSLGKEAGETLPQILRELTDFNPYSEKREVIARNCSYSSLAIDEHAIALIDKFSSPECRFLTIFELDGEKYVRIAHESLLWNWERARALVERESRLFDIRSRITIEFNRWKKAPQKDKRALLLSGLDMVEASELARQWHLDAHLSDYIARSGRVNRSRVGFIVTLSVSVAVLLFAFAIVAWTQWTRGLSALEQASRHALGMAYENASRGDVDAASAYVAQAMDYMANDSAEIFASTLLNTYGNRLVAADGDEHSPCTLAPGATGLDVYDQASLDSAFAAVVERNPVYGFSYTKRLVASSAGDSFFEVSGVEDSEIVSVYSGKGAFVERLIFDESTNYLFVLARGGVLRIWDSKLQAFHGADIVVRGRLINAVVSADGRRLFGVSNDAGIERYHLWRVEDGSELVGFTSEEAAEWTGERFSGYGEGDDPRQFLLSPSGNRVAVLSGRSVLVFDGLGMRLLTIPQGSGKGKMAAFSEDGLMLAFFTEHGWLHVSDAHSNKIVYSRKISGGDVECIGFSGDNSIISMRTEQGVMLHFSLRQSRLHDVRYKSEGRIDGEVVAAADAGDVVAIKHGVGVRVFSIVTGIPLGPSFPLGSEIQHARFSESGDSLVTIDLSNVVSVWDWRSGRLRCSNREPDDVPFFATFSEDSERVTILYKSGDISAIGARDCGIEGRYESRNDVYARTVRGPASDDDIEPSAVAVPFYFEEAFNQLSADSMDSYLATHISPSGLRAIALTTPSMVRLLDLKGGGGPDAPGFLANGKIDHAQFAGNTGRIAVSTSDGRLWLWTPDETDADASGKKGRVEVETPKDAPIASLHFDREGTRMIAAYEDGELLVVKLDEPRNGIRIPTALGPLAFVRFTPNGARAIVAGKNGDLVVWNVSDGLALSPRLRADRRFDYVRVSPDGTLISALARTCACASFWFLRLPIGDEDDQAAFALRDLAGKRLSSRGQLTDIEPRDSRSASDIALDSGLSRSPFMSAVDVILGRAGDGRRPSPGLPLNRDFVTAEIDWLVRNRGSFSENPVKARELLASVYRADPSHPLILLAMSLFEDDAATKQSWQCISLRRLGDDADMSARASEILALSGQEAFARFAAELSQKSRARPGTAAARPSRISDRIVTITIAADEVSSACGGSGTP